MSENTIIEEQRIKHYEWKNVDQILAKNHGEDFYDYRKKWHATDQLEYIPDLPMYILLEVNSYCNLKCKMCLKNYYNSNLNKKNISLDLVDKLVKECKEIKLPSILVGASSECLINPDIKLILQKIKEIEALDNFIITNGLKLTEEISELLVDLQYERIYISLDAATEETYRNIRGANLNIVEGNIRKLIEVREKRKSSLPVIRVSFVDQKENHHEVNQFIEKWRNIVEIIDIQDFCDFKNVEHLQELPNKPYKCPDPFRSLMVDYNGDIYPCCTFYNKYFCLGNLNEVSLLEAWNGSKIKLLRKNILDGNMPMPCRNCIKDNN